MILVIGTSGSGKSTLIGYMLGADIEYKVVRSSYHMHIKSEGYFPKIGNDHSSSIEGVTTYEGYTECSGFI